MATLPDAADVVIVGGSVMGSATALFLAADPAFRGRILVVERDPTYRAASAALSWGGLRQQFSTPENIAMSLFALAFVREAARWLAVDGEVPDLSFREQGYLFLATADGLPVLRDNVARQREAGADVHLLAPDALARQFPWLACDDLAGGAFGRSSEGWIDPNALLHGLRRKARALGAVYVADEAVALERAGGRIAAVRLASGGRVACGDAVLAAGWRSGGLARTAGVALPVGPRKRMTHAFEARADLSAMPLTIDPTGLAVRPEGGRYIAIHSPPEALDPETDDLEPDLAAFETEIWPLLAARVPAFEAVRPAGGWAGLYDYNAFDQNAVIGRHPEIANLVLCTGFSGHGLQQSPAAGRAVAELLVHGGFRSIDLARFGYGRIARGEPLPEANVV